LIACVGAGSNAIGMFYEFLEEPAVRLVGVEAAGLGLDSGKHGASLARGTAGILHGSYSYVLQDEDGQIQEAHSVAAGLDYPSVGPEHSYLKDVGRVEYHSATDDEALAAFQSLSRLEGIIPALESAHAIAYLLRGRDGGHGFSPGEVVVVNLSGRGDKDVYSVADALGMKR
jgi:tryptophan synthase beta chain